MAEKRLRIFHGEATPAAARLYAEYLAEDPSELELVGTVEGPFCQYAHTLTAVSRIRPLPPDRTVLAEAVVPDPCFWTPQMPFTYSVSVELRHGEETRHSLHQTMGIRRWGVRSGSLVLDGKRWVIRAVARESVSGQMLSKLHESSVALVIQSPDEETCREASQLGVLLVAILSGRGSELQAELHRLAKWPAVGIAVLPDELEDKQARPKNLLLGQQTEAAGLAGVDPWADVALVTCTSAEQLSLLADNGNRAVIVWRKAADEVPIEQARSECDRLQRDLAPYGDFAGYIV